MTALWVLVAIIVVGFGYIRLAPSDPSRWHVAPDASADRDMRHGVKRVVPGGPDSLARLDAIIRATPRTTVLAGSVDAGRITYVTRTKVVGFPDYTTVEAKDGQLELYGRLRFGRSDFGVNRNRVDGWLAALRQVEAGS